MYDAKIDKRDSNITTKEITNTNNNNTNNNNTKTTTTESCISGNCTNGYGKLKLSNGTTGEGFFTNGKLNGYGVETYLNTDNYSGNFVNNVKSGYGIYYWKDTNTQYYGQWENDNINGYGYLVKDGKTTAAGIYTNGNLTKDLLVAFKAEKLSNGNCLGNCVDGYGTKTYDNGDGYTGIFYNGKPYKAGNYRWNSSKSSFIGDFDANGKLTNYGMYIADSYVYVGEITQGKLTGKAIKVDKQSGKQIQGEFKDGVLVVDYSNTNTITGNPTQTNTSISNSGCLSGNCIDGYGEYNTGKSKISGFFSGGKANGYGKEVYDDGSGFYTGDFFNGLRQGFGMYTWNKDLSYYIGEWKTGNFHGYGYFKKGSEVYQAGYYENGKQIRNMLTQSYINKKAVGNCVGDCNNGFGYYQFPSGGKYVGFFTNRQTNHVGAYTWASGDAYIGTITNGQFTGQGTQFYKSAGTTYYGNFSNGNRQGMGVYLNKSNIIEQKGYWENGTLQTTY